MFSCASLCARIIPAAARHLPYLMDDRGAHAFSADETAQSASSTHEAAQALSGPVVYEQLLPYLAISDLQSWAGTRRAVRVLLFQERNRSFWRRHCLALSGPQFLAAAQLISDHVPSEHAPHSTAAANWLTIHLTLSSSIAAHRIMHAPLHMHISRLELQGAWCSSGQNRSVQRLLQVPRLRSLRHVGTDGMLRAGARLALSQHHAAALSSLSVEFPTRLGDTLRRSACGLSSAAAEGLADAQSWGDVLAALSALTALTLCGSDASSGYLHRCLQRWAVSLQCSPARRLHTLHLTRTALCISVFRQLPELRVLRLDRCCVARDLSGTAIAGALASVHHLQLLDFDDDAGCRMLAALTDPVIMLLRTVSVSVYLAAPADVAELHQLVQHIRHNRSAVYISIELTGRAICEDQHTDITRLKAIHIQDVLLSVIGPWDHHRPRHRQC
jgi:hypothetical protein